MYSGTKSSLLPWINNIGVLLFLTCSSAEASFMSYFAFLFATISNIFKTGNSGKLNLAFASDANISQTDVYPLSAIMYFTFDGSSSPDAINTVAAPIEEPCNIIFASLFSSIIKGKYYLLIISRRTKIRKRNQSSNNRRTKYHFFLYREEYKEW